MNPNAPNFSFNSGASSFVPGGANGQQQGQQGQYPNGQGGYYGQQYGQPQGGYYNQYAYGQGGQQPVYGQQPYYGQPQPPVQQQQQYYQRSQQAYQPPHARSQNASPAPGAAGVAESWEDTAAEAPPAPRRPIVATDKPKTISIGTPKASAAAANTEQPKTVSLSIGGKPANVTTAAAGEKEKAKEKEAEKPAAKSEESRPSTADSTSAPAPAAVKAEKAAEKTTPKKTAESVSISIGKKEKTAPSDVSRAGRGVDAIEQQIATAVDEETVKDLFGAADAEVADDGKPHLNVVFIGHVDAGKSTMGGNILYLCDMVDKRTMEKYEKEAKEAGRESWYLSWALDSTAQERAKGKTVEVGRAYFETEARRYTILDAPGHKSYVPSMISGAAQADTAILVISARKGEFETGFERGGQTREHIVLVKTAGIQKLIVAINKMDDTTVNWSKERYDEIVGKITPFLKGTGFNPKTEVTFMPVSGYTGANLKVRLEKGVAPWYDGPALLEYLDSMPMTDRKINAPLMMPVSEKYKDMGAIVVGKIESGRARVGDKVMVMPNKAQVEIAAIYSENEEEVDSAMCGDNVRFRLRGIDDEDISVGFVLTDVRKPVHAVTHFEAQLAILDHKNIICAGYSAVLHVHTAAEEIKLASLLHYYDKKTGRKSRRPPQFAKKGQKIVALVECAAPICIERFSDHPQLGRFTLRDEGKTIAIGKVTRLIEKADEMPNVGGINLNTGAPTAAAA